ncbi:MAG: hypothetical protein HY927_04155 [Elusimicrobia bacterium]|nr:hypothetical protein [Elusimicrobiota bacterium]
MSTTKSILYFDRPGPRCLKECAEAAAMRAESLGLGHAVCATTSGRTALALAKALRRAGSRAKVVGVAYAENYARRWGRLDPEVVARAEKLGAAFTRAGHAMGGINAAVGEDCAGLTPNKLVARTYYTLGQGFKVAVEAVLMAADQGLIPSGGEVLALGGTATGADTALVVRPACSAEFFSLRVLEVVCMPRIIPRR